MLYRFPEGTRGIVRRAYTRPYPDPIRGKAGDAVTPDLGKTTDLFGWIWCSGPEGRGGWVPEAWIDRTAQPWRLRRDFNALELSVAAGDRLWIKFSESGFLWVTTERGETGWVPDACVELVRG